MSRQGQITTADKVRNMSNSERRRAEQIIAKNESLVWFVIDRQYPHLLNEMFRDDAFLEGKIGLLYAIASYDGCSSKFSTYAFGWVRQAVGRFAENMTSEVRIPSYRRVGATALTQLERLYFKKYRRPAESDAQLAVFANYSEEFISGLRATCYPPTVISYNAPRYSEDPEGESCHNYYLGDSSEIDRLVSECADLSSEEMWVAIRKLPETQRSILLLRVVEEYTLEEIGELLGVTRERVRQRLVKIVQALRKELGVKNTDIQSQEKITPKRICKPVFPTSTQITGFQHSIARLEEVY